MSWTKLLLKLHFNQKICLLYVSYLPPLLQVSGLHHSREALPALSLDLPQQIVPHCGIFSVGLDQCVCLSIDVSQVPELVVGAQ